MEDAIAAFLINEEEEDDEIDEEYDQHVLLCVTLLGHGILESRRIKADRYRANRHYLTRPVLLPNPRGRTPWQRLYASCNDKALITVVGIDYSTFHLILDNGFSQSWTHSVIPRADTSSGGNARQQRRSLDAAGALGLALYHLTSTVPPNALALAFALVPTTVQRYLRFSMSILFSTLCSMHQARISWPQGDEFETLNSLVIRRHPLLNGAFGAMDGLNIPLQKCADVEFENATYNGWLHAHFVSNVFVFAPTGEILACKLNAPGSWNDARLARNIYKKLLHRTPDGFYLIADAAFPRGDRRIDGRIKVPLTVRSHLPSDETERAKLLAFDRQVLSYRQTAEWGNHTLQSAFGRLHLPLPVRDHGVRANMLEVCARLHNLRTRLVGLNQIRTVYMPLWRPMELDAVWEGFEGRLLPHEPHSTLAHFEAITSRANDYDDCEPLSVMQEDGRKGGYCF